MPHHPTIIFTSDADHVVAEIMRRLNDEVRKSQQCERRAKMRGDAAAADKHHARWLYIDIAGGFVAEVAAALKHDRRVQMLRAVLDDLVANNRRCDGEEFAEAAD